MNATKRQFSRAKSLGARDNAEIAQYLMSIGDQQGAMAVMQAGAAGAHLSVPGYKPAWKHTGVVVGYLKPSDLAGTATPSSATSITADASLAEARIKITLDRFYVCSYPGFGKHHILCEYWGKNQAKLEKGKKSTAEEMRFVLNIHANDNAAAGVQGQPLFVGVAVGKDGLAFEARAVNVSSKTDEKILRALNHPAVKNGLSLMTLAQPALKPFVGLAGALVNSAVDNKNEQVHEFFLGLDFSDNPTSAKLRLGSYIVVQTDDSEWNWNDYQWSGQTNLLVHKQTGKQVDANYSVLGVSPFEEP